MKGKAVRTRKSSSRQDRLPATGPTRAGRLARASGKSGERARDFVRRAGGWLRDLLPQFHDVDWKSFWHRFLVSLAIAVGLEAALHALHGHPLLESMNDRAMDWVMGLYRGETSSGDPPLTFTYLDIDDETWRQWQEPLFVGRDRLKTLIEAVAALGPALIVVDVDVSQLSGTGGDEVLAGFLRGYDAEPGRPPLILPVAFRTLGSRPAGGEAGEVVYERRSSFLEGVVSGQGKILWASPLFYRDRDWSVRRWRLWEAVRSRDAAGRPCAEIVPSIQLLAAGLMLERGMSTRDLSCRIERALAGTMEGICRRPGRDCGGGEVAREGHGPEADVQVGPLAISTQPSRVSQRIFYRFPARGQLREGERYPAHPATGAPLLSVLPAHPATQRTPPHLSPELFTGRIVVIGGSFAEGRDVYPTPLGPMPGAMILINSIDSLVRHGQIEELHGPKRYLLVLVLVLALSLIFTLFHSIKGSLLSGSLVILILLPASVALLGDGYWLDFAIPLFGVVLHKVAAELHELVEGRRATGEPGHGGPK